MPDKPHSPTRTRRRWKPIFLRSLKDKGTIVAACEVAGINRSTAYEARKDPQFAEEWDALQTDIVAVLEATAFELAVQGNERMLTLLLKANRPDYYRENVHIEGNVTHKLELEIDAETRQLEQALDVRAKALPPDAAAPRQLAGGDDGQPGATPAG